MKTEKEIQTPSCEMDEKRAQEFVEEIKEQHEEETIKGAESNEKLNALFDEAMASLKTPVKYTDGKFELGEGELDIRSLSKKNKDQLNFRMQSATVALLHKISQDNTDIMRLLMLVLKKLGVNDIEKEISDLIDELAKKVSEKTTNKA